MVHLCRRRRRPGRVPEGGVVVLPMTHNMELQPPYLPPSPPAFLVPSPGLVSPQGLQPSTFQYPAMCPGMPVHIIQEHQQLIEKVNSQQRQLHRLHLELGAVHNRLSEEGDLLARLDARLMVLESENRDQESGVRRQGGRRPPGPA